MKLTCPKCKSPNAWLAKTATDLLVRCWCGAERVLFTTLLDTIEGPLETEPEDETGMKLPKMGSNLYKTLVVLSVMPEATSQEITQRINELNGVMKVPGKVTRLDLKLTVSDVSSYLTILGAKGMVVRTEIRRGVPGGSSWVLTPGCAALFEEVDDGSSSGS